MEGGGQWGTLAAGGHVASAKVVHGSYPRALGDDVGITQLQRRRRSPIRGMGDRLAMAADGVDVVAQVPAWLNQNALAALA